MTNYCKCGHPEYAHIHHNRNCHDCQCSEFRQVPEEKI